MTEAGYYAQKWLKRTESLEKSLEAGKMSLLELEARINGGITHCSLSGIRRSAPGNTREDLIAAYIDKQTALKFLCARLLSEDIITYRALEKHIENHVYIALLFERYINRTPWQIISKKTGKGRSTLFVMHRDALEALGAKIMPGAADPEQ